MCADQRHRKRGGPLRAPEHDENGKWWWVFDDGSVSASKDGIGIYQYSEAIELSSEGIDDLEDAIAEYRKHVPRETI